MIVGVRVIVGVLVKVGVFVRVGVLVSVGTGVLVVSICALAISSHSSATLPSGKSISAFQSLTAENRLPIFS